jgi:hypothetical protein
MPATSDFEAARVDEAFHRFRAAALRPPRYTLDNARRTVRRRRQARLAAAAVAAVLAAVIPVAVHATTGRHPTAPNRPAVHATPTASPTGQLAAALRNAALEIPTFAVLGCQYGRVTFSDGRFVSQPPRPPGMLRLQASAEVAALTDASKQIAVVVRCEQPAPGQAVLLLERGADGTFATRTTVVNLDPASGAEITDVRAGPNATIEVELRLAEAGGKAGRQVRMFGWNGSRFVQVAGPISIPTAAPATDLTATASDVVFSAPANNRRSATLTVTVANHGPLSVDRIRLTFLMRNLAIHTSSPPENEEWRSHCTFDGYSLGDDKVTCEYPGMAAGASATHHLTFNTAGEIGGMGGIFDYHQLTVDAVDARVKTDSNPLDNAAGYQIDMA